MTLLNCWFEIDLVGETFVSLNTTVLERHNIVPVLVRVPKMVKLYIVVPSGDTSRVLPALTVKL